MLGSYHFGNGRRTVQESLSRLVKYFIFKRKSNGKLACSVLEKCKFVENQ